MYSLRSVVAFFVCFFALSFGQDIVDCGSKLGTINRVSVQGCKSSVCRLQRGTRAFFELEFTANQKIETVKTDITAVIMGYVRVKFYPDDLNACHFINNGTGCPIQSGETVFFKQELEIKPNYPEIAVWVEWRLMSGSDIITCFGVRAKIES